MVLPCSVGFALSDFTNSNSCFSLFSLSAHICRKLFGTLTCLASLALTNELSNTISFCFSNKTLIAQISGRNRNLGTVLPQSPPTECFSNPCGAPEHVFEILYLFTLSIISTVQLEAVRGAGFRGGNVLVVGEWSNSLWGASHSTGASALSAQRTSTVCFHGRSPKHHRGVGAPWWDFTCYFFLILFWAWDILCGDIYWLGIWVWKRSCWLHLLLHLQDTCKLNVSELCKNFLVSAEIQTKYEMFHPYPVRGDSGGRVLIQTRPLSYSKSRDLQLQNSLFQKWIRRKQVQKAPA